MTLQELTLLVPSCHLCLVSNSSFCSALLSLLTLYFSSYPHGGYVSAGLLLSCCAAFSATCYAVASCRFLELTFETDQGSFENHFSTNPVSGNRWHFYRASIGLFQWLRPVDAI